MAALVLLPAVERRSVHVAQEAVGTWPGVAALLGTAPVAGSLSRRLGDLAGAVLLRPAIEQGLHDLADLGRVVDIANRQHTGDKQRMDVLFAQIDADQVVFLLTAGHRDRLPGRLRGRVLIAGCGDLGSRRLLGRLLHPQCLLQAFGRAAQALQAVARCRTQVLRLVERLLQSPDLSPHQRELAAQTGNDLGPQVPLFIGNVNCAILKLTHGSILRPLVARHRRSPTLSLLPPCTVIVAVALHIIAERSACHRPRLMLRLTNTSLRQSRSMRPASNGLSDWRHKGRSGGDNGLDSVAGRGSRKGEAISRTGCRGDRGRRSG